MQTEKIRILFFGTPQFAASFLDALIKSDSFEVVGVVTQPDKPTGRKQVLTPPPVKDLASKHGLKVFQPEKLSFLDEAIDLTGQLKELIPDLLVVVAYGQIIPKDILDIAKHGAINVHPSLLPKYRGASPMQSAILAGEKVSGVTIMLMDEKMDHGPILAQEEIKLNGDETNESLHDKASQIGIPLLIETIKKYVAGEITPTEQNHDEATFRKTISRSDAKIDWNKSAEEISRQVRAFHPWPGTWTTFDGMRLKIFPPVNILEINKPAGELFVYENSLAVGCDAGALGLSHLQLEGKKQMSAKEFLNGNREIAGKILI